MVYFKLGIILLLLLSVSIKETVSAIADNYEQCEHIVKKWASSSLDSDVKGDKHELRDLLFFLHIPRTGGRTYLHCFLKKLYSNSLECPRSYDKLRFNPRMVKRVRGKTSGVSTLDIWPWKYLVPWMREDLFARRDARKLKGGAYLVTNNPYDMEDILMPLHEYINNPISQDIIHNGATFQIAGLTNNSYFVEAHDIRHCVFKHKSLGEYVLKVAKKRLDDMLYVGLTEKHRESATMFANVVGAQVISQHLASGSSTDVASNDDSEQSSSLSDAQHDANNQGNDAHQMLKNISSTRQDEVGHKNLTVGKLMEAYESCISTLRNTQAERRVNSLKRISPANLSKEARLMVPEALIQEITLLNSLDVELYNYAHDIFAKQQSHMMQSMAYAEKVESTFNSSAYADFYGPPSWKFPSLLAISGFLLFLFIFIFLSSRRTSKVKL
ncbi:protein-tyrosine sulfotransferase isoform X3 [Primulina huaijiensis]|uniref:protein-tyrosine sulfotransferase isoform X3 n=1 Tax=Primulina huaijiensis TaxID=1492673 RepID=UPI003CC71780